MDVKCERCQTEYEFDDALVSGRGTTVKCTNCGHKFKIKRGDGDLADDYWNVTTGDGRTLVFTSLRELQRAIQGYLVERTDRLSRGGLPPKPIGAIPELVPFFEQRETKKNASGQNSPAAGPPNPNQKSVKTHDGIGGPPPAPIRSRQATMVEYPPLSEDVPGANKATLIGTGPLSEEEAIPRANPAAVGAIAKGKSTPPPVPTRERVTTQQMTRPKASNPPPPVPTRSAVPRPGAGSNAPVPPATTASNASTPPAAAASTSPTPPPVPEKARSAPPVPEKARSAPPVPKPAPPPEPVSSLVQARAVQASEPPPQPVGRTLLSQIEEERDARRSSIVTDYDSVPDLAVVPRRRPVGGFIVAVVVLAGVVGVGVLWAQKNLGGLTGGTKPVASAPAVDPRVATFLTTGEKALADGNIDLAKESFDKASALAEKDPHVLLALARLAAVRADVPWLKERLLSPDAADDLKLAQSERTDLANSAKKASDDALGVAADDPAALRAKIDALRIGGDRAGALALVGKISASATQPESAYVLAALDLADAEPPWSTVIDRLKTASSVETGPGRARAALIYALARSGDAAGAKAEVDRLAAMARPHPLLPLLRAYADRAKPKADAGAAAVEATPATTPAPGTKPAAGAPTDDPRNILSNAEKARQKGDYPKAKSLYEAAADKNPNDSEALTGLAQVAYAQHDLDGARNAYKRVLAINPNYMPALVGLADVEWESGNHDSAAKMYKDITDRYPEGSYPARAKQRSEGAGG